MNDDMETEPMVSFGPSSNYVGSNNQQRRRRPAGCKPEKPRRQNSFSRDIGHAAAETYLITRLTFTLLRYLGYCFFFSTCFMMASDLLNMDVSGCLFVC